MHRWGNQFAERANRHLQQQSLAGSDKEQAQPPEQSPGPEHVSADETHKPDVPPEKNHADWRRMMDDPDYRRQVEEREVEVRAPQHQQTRETPQQAGPDGDQPEKKREEKEFDWRRALTDPDYSHEIREQERAEQLERTAELRLAHGQEVEAREPQHQQSYETPQQARPTGDQPEKKPEEKEFDWRRALTDPDYSREIREQERAERLERTGEQTQEQGVHRTSVGHEL